jgi:glycosyltransferase involved in cell wall biosynthesis
MKASALIITYNQEKTLATAVESALMQTANFDFEVVVAEDHSTDGTRDVAQELERRHPGKVRAICRDKNLGGTANLIEAVAVCRGEYVALLEGDDRWTDPRKLQRQADFLDAHADCSLCCHTVNFVYEDGSWPSFHFPDKGKTLSSLEDILSGVRFHTCSYMFRRLLLSSPPDWLRTLWIGDWPILMLLAEQGYVGYIDEVMAEYRIHPGGVWSGASSTRQNEGSLEMYRRARQHLGSRYFAHTAWLVAWWACRVSYDRDSEGRRDEARALLVEAVDLLLQETPGDQRLIDGLIKNVVRLAAQTPTALSLDAERLRAEVDRLRLEGDGLRREVARRDRQLAGVSGELALLKASRFWRVRQLLFSAPGLRKLLLAFRQR